MRRSDEKKRGRGDAETRRRGDARTQGRGEAEAAASGTRAIVIGLSGAIASGKTFVAEAIAQSLDCTVISADAIAHDVLAGDPHVRQEIMARWGDSCLDESGGISRAKLARIVFERSDDLAELNRIIHPVILRRIEDEIDSARKQGAAWIVLDAALLFETGLDAVCDIKIFVESDWTIRAERARRDRGWSGDDLRRRDAAQLPVQRKITFSDYIVNNNGTKDETKRQIETIIERIKRHRRTNNGKHENKQKLGLGGKRGAGDTTRPGNAPGGRARRRHSG